MPVRNDSSSARPITRSRSLFGSLKSLLPSAIWSRETGGQPDTPGKRKGNADEPYEVEEGKRSSKRQKVAVSPVRESTRLQGAQRREQLVHPPPPAVSGYLEPPDDFFPPTNTTGVQRQLGHARAASLTPSIRQPSNGAPRAFAAGLVPNTRPFARTQSMDPPNRYRPSFAAASKPIPLTRDVSMDDGSFSNEMSVSPTHQPFRMRTSLTPAPSGQAFGPDPARLGRNESEPPPLALLGDKPVFVKAPSEAPISRTVARQAPNTLGALAESQRTGKGIQRSHSSLKIGSDTSMQDLSETSVPAPTRPVTQTEKMIRELEVYKTPLLPTRLRGSPTIPDMFKPKKAHAPVLMHDRETRPRLGTADKHGSSDKALDEGRSAKPYAGRGGMKKLLERRRLEEDEEKEKEKFDAIETDVDEVVETSRRARDLDEELVKELENPQDPEFQSARPFIPGREQSSLRIGRQRTGRNHIARPQAKARAGRFSALYEEEDEDAMDDGHKVDTPRPKPMFEPPPGFSFAKGAPSPSHDSIQAKEPPIATLPFSLTKSTSGPSPPIAFSQVAQDSSKPIAKSTLASLPKGFANDRDVPHPTPPVTVGFAPAPLTPSINTVPQIALIPPSPGNSDVLATAPKQPVAEQSDARLTGKDSSAVPNFFANSAALSKPSAQVNLPSNFSFGVPSSTTSSVAAPTNDTSSFFSKQPEAKDSAAPPKSAFNLPGASSPTLDVSTHAGDGKNPIEVNKALPTSLFKAFGNAEPTSTHPEPPAASTLSEPLKAPAPAKEVPPAASPFTFGQPTIKAAEPTPAATSSFSLGAPSQSAERPASTPSPLPFQFGAPSKPAEPATGSDSRPSTGDALKLPFAFGPAHTSTQTSAFGVSSATPSPSTVEPAKSPFVFGQPTAQPTVSPAATATSTTSLSIEAPKPAFGAFNFGQPPSTPEPAKSPFTFAGPSTPNNENKFGFGASTSTPAPTTSSQLFGSAANGTPAATRTVTPPKKDDSEVMMDESPVRGVTMETPRKPELSKLNGGFGGASSPFSQPTQNSSGPFGFGGASSPNPFATKPEGKPAEKSVTPFNFGQPATTGGFTFGHKAPEAGSTTTAGGFGFNHKAPETNAASSAGGFFAHKAPEATTAPTTSGSFPFASPATPSASTSPVFSFGAPQIATSSSFGQPVSATSSAPSPNPFSQPAQPGAFGFGAPTPTTATATSNPFAFGSQPASPAAPSVVLPGHNGNGAFTFNAPNTATGGTPSPFAPPAALPQTGGPVFNMGAAPPPTPGGLGGRQMKKLPMRRGAKR